MKVCAPLFVALVLTFATLTPSLAQPSDPSPAALKTARWQARANLAIPEPGPADKAPLPIERLGAQAAQSLTTGTRIVFQSFRDGNWEIYRANGDGSGVLRLTATPADDVEPRLNRTGQKIVFASNRTGNFELYVMNWDGSGLQRLTNTPFNEREPVWSPDGSKIAFSTDRDGNIEIYTMNANGSGQTRISNHPNSDFAPTWSPANDYIAWVRAVNTTHGQLMRYDIANGAATSFSAPLRFLDTPVYQSLISPFGSPEIAYSADINGDFFNDIFALGYTIIATTGDLTDYFMGSWSPDDQAILLTQVNYREEGNQLVPTDQLVIYAPLSNTLARVNYIAGNAEASADWRWNDTQAPWARVYAPSGASRLFGSGTDVRWSGTDRGSSGIQSYEVQVRVGNGAWQTWVSNTLATQSYYYYPPTLNGPLRFRARAQDRAGNVAPWGPDDRYDVEFIPYNYRIDGRITDNRNQGLADVAVDGSPSPMVAPLKTNLSGNFVGYFATGGDYQFTFSRAGYGQFAPWRYTFTSFADLALANYLPPQSNAIANGDFESSPALFGWQTIGNVEGITTRRNTGLQAARLHFGCAWPCATSELLPAGSKRDWVLGPDGVQHLVREDRTAGAILYASRPVGGDWSAPVPIDSFAITDNTEALRLALDGLGNLHVIHTTGGTLRYIHRLGVTWQSPITLAQNAWRPKLIADGTGTVHLTYLSSSLMGPSSSTLYYRERQGGTWQPPVEMTNFTPLMLEYRALDATQMAVGGDGTLHIFSWRLNNGAVEVGYWVKAPGGNLTLLAPPINGSAVRPVGAFADATGSIHALLTVQEDTTSIGFGKLYYFVRPAGGSWSAPELVSEVRGNGLHGADLVVDSTGRRHLVYLGRSETGFHEAVYVVREPDGSITIPFGFANVADTEPIVPAITLTSSGEVLLSVRPFRVSLTRIPVASQAGTAAISQAVTVPAGAHKPTLAFMHQLRGALPSYASTLRVKVTDNVGMQTLLEKKTPAGDWTLQWLDMSAWAGQTVTVTIEMAQAAGAPYTEAWLDAASLGEWTTPVLTQVTPARLPGNQPGTVVTLTGLNFIATPTVKLGDATLDDVQFVDETTVRAIVPAGFPVGLYDVTVANPGGQYARRAGALQIGERVTTPIVLR